MAYTTLCLVRHGETTWNHQGRLQGSIDVPLSDRGRWQARGVARRLATERWDEIYSSGLARARTTARIIGEAVRLTPRIDDRVTERNYGPLEGMMRHKIELLYPRFFFVNSPYTIAGVEPLDDVKARARSFLDTVGSMHPHHRIVTVSHGGWINAVLSALSGGELGTTALANGSVTRLERLVDGEWRIALINDTSHLQGRTEGPSEPLRQVVYGRLKGTY